jgi:hypothetical protein
MPRAYARDAPQVARRTSDVRERREWEQKHFNPKNPAISPQRQAVLDYWDAVHKAEQEQERRWAAEAKEREAAVAARYDEIEQHNKRVIARRTFQLLLTAMFEQRGASDTERDRVKSLVERNHPEQTLNAEFYEYTLLRLRGELDHADRQGSRHADWRGFLQQRRTNA